MGEFERSWHNVPLAPDTSDKLHQTLARNNNRVILASRLKMTRQEHKDTWGDAAADTTGPMAAADASHAPESLSAPPHAAASAVPAACRPPARGQPRLPVSLALNSAQLV